MDRSRNLSRVASVLIDRLTRSTLSHCRIRMKTAAMFCRLTKGKSFEKIALWLWCDALGKVGEVVSVILFWQIQWIFCFLRIFHWASWIYITSSSYWIRLSYDMKNSADQGGCYPQRSKAEVDNTLRDLQNYSYPTKAEVNNCFIIHSKYFLVFKVRIF